MDRRGFIEKEPAIPSAYKAFTCFIYKMKGKIRQV